MQTLLGNSRGINIPSHIITNTSEERKMKVHHLIQSTDTKGKKKTHTRKDLDSKPGEYIKEHRAGLPWGGEGDSISDPPSTRCTTPHAQKSQHICKTLLQELNTYSCWRLQVREEKKTISYLASPGSLMHFFKEEEEKMPPIVHVHVCIHMCWAGRVPLPHPMHGFWGPSVLTANLGLWTAGVAVLSH